jgi:hypothetical protein
MGRFITAVAAAGLTVAGLAVVAAVPAWGRESGGVGRGLQVINLHAVYEAHLGHTRPGKIAGIAYAKGKQPGFSTTKASCAEPNCPLVYGGGTVQHKPRLYLVFWGPAWSSDSGERAAELFWVCLCGGVPGHEHPAERG